MISTCIRFTLNELSEYDCLKACITYTSTHILHVNLIVSFSGYIDKSYIQIVFFKQTHLWTGRYFEYEFLERRVHPPYFIWLFITILKISLVIFCRVTYVKCLDFAKTDFWKMEWYFVHLDIYLVIRYWVG